MNYLLQLLPTLASSALAAVLGGAWLLQANRQQWAKTIPAPVAQARTTD